MSGLFGGRSDVSRPLRDLVTLGAMMTLGVMMRLVDAACLITKPKLLRAYAKIVLAAQVRSPFREGSFARIHLARQARQSLGELVYGETPVVTALSLFRRGGVDANSSVLDLGAGRGRVLLAARRLGARADGIELLPEHIEAVGGILADVDATLRQGDAATETLDGATHVFLTWTCLSEATRTRVLENLRRVAPGTVVYTVTFPLEDADFEPLFAARPLFSWGFADVYAARRR